MSDNPLEQMTNAFEEHDFTPDGVTLHEDPRRQADVFRVVKKLGGERRTVEHSIQMEQYISDDYKPIARAADQIARTFKQEMVDVISMGDQHFRLSAYQEAWARCGICGTRVELDDLRGGDSFIQDAEASVPNPTPMSTEVGVYRLDDQERLMLKMYLIGALRAECDHGCPNSRSAEPHWKM